MKDALYWIVVVCFLAAGALDARAGCWREAATAWLFAVANATIFLWR